MIISIMKKIRSIFKNEFSGTKAKDHTEYITQFYRSHGSSGIKASTNYCMEQLDGHGLDEIIIETFPVDGESNLMGRIVYPTWEPRDVVLKIVDPVEEEIVNYNDTSTCIEWFSTPTPPGGVTAEIVDVGRGTMPEDYEGKDVKEKIVLASGGGPLNMGVRLYELAVERYGALGVVTDFLLGEIPGIRSRTLRLEFVGLLRQPRTFNKGWSIVISGIKGARLRELMKKGPVKVWANVDTVEGAETGENLIAVIMGSKKPDEEVFVVGHLSATKPGGNCATGPALMIEAARTLSQLILKGDLPRPKRTIKFLFVPEGLGSEAYIKEHWEERESMLGGLCLCGVGEDQGICRSSLVLSRTPDSVPSFMDDLCEHVLKNTASKKLLVSGPMRYGTDPYSPFSDNSSFILSGIPCVLLSSKPNLYFHTQFLTADKMDAEVFETAGSIVMETIYNVADAGIEKAMEIANIVKELAESRLGEISTKSYEELLESDPYHTAIVYHKWMKKLDYTLERDMRSLSSTSRLVRGLDDESILKGFLEETKADLRAKGERVKERVAAITRMKRGGAGG